MRFSKFVLAAGLTASAFAAPVAQRDEDDSCEAEYPEPQTSSTSSVTSSSSSSVAAAVQAAFTSMTSSSVASPPAASVTSSSTTVSPVAAVATTSTSAKAATTSSSSAGSGKLQWIGVNESGAEFGNGNIPGTEGTDYTFPNTTAIQTLIDDGMNIFRIPFLMERMAQGTMTATIDADYLAGITTVVDYITKAGKHAVLDAQNFGRYSGSVITSTSDFETFWTNVATEFKSNENVIFDCNNEFHDMPSNELVAQLNQACVTGIRNAGATTQYIFVEGTSYTGAWTWVSSGNSVAMLNITDPNDNIVYEFHQYLDSDGSGTSETCVNSTIGADRIAVATEWLKTNSKKGIIGEYAGGVNDVCETAVKGMLDALSASNDVWLGALWWGAGPWWADYMFSFEPPSGTAYVAYKDTVVGYVSS